MGVWGSSRRTSDCTPQTNRAIRPPQNSTIMAAPHTIHQPAPSCHIGRHSLLTPGGSPAADQLDDAEPARLHFTYVDPSPPDVSHRVPVDVCAHHAHDKRIQAVHHPPP